MKLPLDDFEKFIDVETPLIGVEGGNLLKNDDNIKLDINNPTQIYDEMAKLAQTSNEILTTTKYFLSTTNEPNSEMIIGISNVMNSLRDTLKEFTKVHNDQLVHQRKLELEKQKFEYKKELLKLKKELSEKNPIEAQTINKVPYSQEQIMKMLENQED